MNLQNTSDYTIDSIETLPFREAVRRRIQMYLGSNDNEGAIHGLQEIISNSIDEFIMGYGNEIVITLHGDNVVSVRDYGRGVPFGQKADGTNTLQAIYSSPHTGGKFNDKAYQFAVGLNGIGAKATCLSSESFSVVSSRDGKLAAAVFEKGNLVDYKETDNTDNVATGTFVKYKPDAEVFNLEPINLSFERICNICKNLSYLTKGLKFTIINNETNEKQEYQCNDGLVDLIKDTIVTPVHPTVIYHSISDGDNSVEIALQWSKGKEKSFCFTNGVLNAEGGTPITGMKTAITRTLNKYFKGGLTGELARTGLVYAISCKVANPSFANQTKTKINNPELRSLADKAFSEAFTKFRDIYPGEAKKIEDFLLKEKKAEEAADKARHAVLNAQKEVETNGKKKVLLADKLKDCREHGEESILCITEGDSALGALVQGRPVDTVALIPIRGKIISALKNSTEDVLANEEVKAIFSALGCGFFDKYNSKKLRYGRVGIAADQDQDGNNIFVLIATLFYFMAPEILKEGRLYRIQSPLYILRYKKETIYAFSNEEKEKYLAQKGRNCEVSRIKGLGELRPEDTRKSVFGTEKRWDRLIINDWEDFVNQMNLIMGKEVPPRREYIMNNVDFSRVEE